MQNFINFLAKNNRIKNKQQYENKKYDITGIEAISYRQSAEILSNVLGRWISYVDVLEEYARESMKNTGMKT